MANVSAPNTAGEIVTVYLYPGIVGAKGDITLPAYYPDFDITEPNPILSIGRANIAVAAVSALSPANCVATDAANVAGTYRPMSARIFRLGNACIATTMLSVTYKAAGNIKRD